MRNAAILLAFFTAYFSGFVAIASLFLFIIFFLMDTNYDRIRQWWAKIFSLEIEAHAEDEERIETPKQVIDSFELVKEADELWKEFEFQYYPDKFMSTGDHFRRIVNKVRMIIRHRRKTNRVLRDELVYRHIHFVESFDSDSDQDNGLRKVSSKDIDGSNDVEEISEDGPGIKAKTRNFTLKQESNMSGNSNFPPLESETGLMTSGRLAPFNTGAPQFHFNSKGTAELEREYQFEDEVLSTNANYNPLDWPSTAKERVFYVLFFPVNLIFFFLFPNIMDTVSRNKIILMIVILVGCNIGIIILLLTAEYSLMFVFDLKPQLFGIFNAIIFIVP